MESVKIIESLDSVWFFSNVFSMTAQSLAFHGDDEEDHINPKVPIFTTTISEPSKPMTPTLETHQTQPPVDDQINPKGPIFSTTESEPSKTMTPTPETHQTRSPIVEIAVKSCPNYGDLGSEVGESRNRDQKEGRKESNRRLDSGSTVTTEMDFGFDMNEVYDLWMMMEEYKNKMLMTQKQGKTLLPSFSDGMAMKQHLKCWAHAVACNVR